MMTQMVLAVRTHLSMTERATVGRAIDTREIALTSELMKHGGKMISSEEWARLVLSCARIALGENTTP
jgi:hypothetical protein